LINQILFIMKYIVDWGAYTIQSISASCGVANVKFCIK
jgi:hypothetical protein